MGADQIPYNTDDGEKVRVGTITTADRTFQLKHNEYIKIIGLAEGETYTVTEQDAQDYNTTVTPTNGIAVGTAVTVADGAVKTAGQQALATAESTFNRTDFVNSKDAVTPTGIALESIPFVLMIGAAGTALFLVLRKRRYNAR